MKRKRIVLAIFAAIAVASIVFINKMQYSKKKLICSLLPSGSVINELKILAYSDDHNGFHGDGELFCKIQLGEEQIMKVKNDKDNWRSLPIVKEIKDHSFLFPKDFPLNKSYGFYYVHDFQQKESTTEFNYEEEMLTRSSYNFTITILDLEDSIIYLFKLDT